MRVLLVNQYFPPDTSATAVIAGEVARALRGAGHDVTILAGRPSYEPTARRPWAPVRREAWEGCHVVRVGSTAFDRRRMAGRVGNYLTYLALAWLRGLGLRPDVVLAMTDPPLAVLVGAAVARRGGVPLVYNVRDLHPDMAVAAGLLRAGPLSRVWARLHRRGLRAAASVVVLGDDMRERVLAHGVPATRVSVVRDGARPADPPAGDRRLPDALRNGFRFTLVYAGNLGYSGAWGTLLDAARLLEQDGVGLIFVGDGAAAAPIRDAACHRPNVRWFPPQPPELVPPLLAAGDLHVVTVRAGLEGLVVPSKLYPLLAAGRPVLAVAPAASDAARLVQRFACGWTAEPDDAAAVATAVREAIRSPERVRACAVRARAAFPDFERSRHLAALVGIVEQTVRTVPA
jgi:glycosyltransferase involved in cell wall biosynthesis